MMMMILTTIIMRMAEIIRFQDVFLAGEKSSSMCFWRERRGAENFRKVWMNIIKKGRRYKGKIGMT